MCYDITKMEWELWLQPMVPPAPILYLSLSPSLGLKGSLENRKKKIKVLIVFFFFFNLFLPCRKPHAFHSVRSTFRWGVYDWTWRGWGQRAASSWWDTAHSVLCHGVWGWESIGRLLLQSEPSLTGELQGNNASLKPGGSEIKFSAY